MRGDNWDGTAIDISTELLPIIDAMLAHQDGLRMSGRDVCRKIGVCHTWLAELIYRMKNPRLGRLCRWAQAIDVQELGLFVTIDGEYSTHCCYDIDQPVPWVFEASTGRQVPDFRANLAGFIDLMRRHRRLIAPSVEEFIQVRGLKVSRSVMAAMESGHGVRSATFGHLATWAKAVGATHFGAYVLIDGAFTDAYLLGNADE